MSKKFNFIPRCKTCHQIINFKGKPEWAPEQCGNCVYKEKRRVEQYAEWSRTD